MKRVLSCIAIVALIALASCGGDSPTAPPVPTVVPSQWAISLVADPTAVYVDQVVSLTAYATMNGAAAPDGTIVTFTVSGTEIAQKTTQDGLAVTGFTAGAAGTYAVTARVHAVERTVAVTFSDRGDSEVLRIETVQPSEGAFDGGEQVILKGNAIVAPAEVDFIVDGKTYAADIVSVQDSIPLAEAGQITVRTPYINGVDRSVGQTADIAIRTGVGTANPQEFTMPDGFTFLAEQELQIFQALDPNSGGYEGGDTVVLTGRGIRAPARVTFILVASGTEFPAIVHSVTASVPLSAEGTITIETPFIPVGERPIDPVLGLQPAFVDVLVEVGINQPNVLSQTLSSAFTYVPQGSEVPEVWRLEYPSIYLLIEAYGSSQGGYTVIILGRNFRAKKYAADGVTVIDTDSAIVSVKFGAFEAAVLSVSEDGTQATVQAPRYSVTPLEADTPVTVTLDTAYPLAVDNPDPAAISIPNGFVYLADRPTPVITALSPIAGPLDGGTEVTISGHGFQFPLQVTFGDLAADAVNLTDDQTLTDNDLITCLSPNYAQQNQVPPVAVDVIVHNVNSGKVSNALTFTYGDNLYITGNTPAEGRRGGLVIIYGSGFEDPLHVDFTGLSPNSRLEVVSVSGTEITVRFPTDADPVCNDVTGTFIVTLLERDGVTALGTATGGRYTYLGNTPTVTDVQPTFVQSFNDGDGVTPSQVTIHGLHFYPNLFVDIDTYRMHSSDITVVDENNITLRNLPAPNDFNLTWDTGACLTDTGLAGIRDVATPVDVTVTNFPGECSDTLVGAIIYEPDSDECIVAPNMVVLAPVFPDTPAGSCSAGQTMMVQNTGAGTLDIQSVALTGRFYFNGVYPPSNQLAGAMTVAPFGVNTSLVLYFCPDVESQTYSGQVTILSNDPGSPDIIALSGTELQQPLIQTAPFANTDTWTFPTTAAGGSSASQTLTISNTGDANLVFGTITATAPFVIVTAAPPTIAPLASANIELQFQPTVDNNANQTGTLTINSNALNTPSVVINLEGQEQP